MGHTTLISAAGLAAHLRHPDWVVVDCRFSLSDPLAGRRAWERGHIPGARYAHLEEDLSAPAGPGGRHPLPDPDALAARLRSWGIGDATQVVAYDDSFGSMAGRLWWLLRWLGHDNVALLDGGLPAWKRAGGALSDAPAELSPARFTVRRHDVLQADAAAVLRALEADEALLLDARPEERFAGEIEPFDRVAGHIPGSINRPWEDNLDLSGELLPAAELREEYERLLGGRAPQRVIHLCGSGVTACLNLLAMEHAGLAGSRLYPGSWSEWIEDPARPVATGEAQCA